MSRKEILKHLKIIHANDNEVDVLLSSLRKNMGTAGKKLFKNARGRGFYFDPTKADSVAFNS